MVWLKLRKLTELDEVSGLINAFFGRTLRTARFYLQLLYLLRPSIRVKQNQSVSNVVLIATDFLPSIHGGIYRPLSWLKYASLNDVKMLLLTNQSLRPHPVGLSMLTDAKLVEKIQYCAENDFQVFFRPTRLWLSRPEFLLAALERLEIINKAEKISQIIATGPDFTSFVIATIFARKHRCRVHLDYRDEWTESPFEFSQATLLARLLEKCCVHGADSISMTTQSQLNHFNNVFDRFHNVFLKQNGCDNFPLNTQHSRFGKKSIRLCHSGSIGGHNSLAVLASVLKELIPSLMAIGMQIELRFCGVIADSQNNIIKDDNELNIKILGQLTPEQAFDEISNADLNILLIDQRFQRYLPGKLYGYISTGNPILIIGAAHCIEIATLCNEYSVPHHFVDTQHFDLAACTNFISISPTLKTPAEQLARFRFNLNRQTLAEEFFHLFIEIENAKN